MKAAVFEPAPHNESHPLPDHTPRKAAGAAIEGRVQPPGVNGLPSEAGMLARIQTALLEINTSTTIVAR